MRFVPIAQDPEYKKLAKKDRENYLAGRIMACGIHLAKAVREESDVALGLAIRHTELVAELRKISPSFDKGVREEFQE